MLKQKVNLVVLTEGVFKRKNVLSASVVCATICCFSLLLFVHSGWVHHIKECVVCECMLRFFSPDSSFITVIFSRIYFTLHIRLWCLLFDRYGMCCCYFFLSFFRLFFLTDLFIAFDSYDRSLWINLLC